MRPVIKPDGFDFQNLPQTLDLKNGTTLMTVSAENKNDETVILADKALPKKPGLFWHRRPRIVSKRDLFLNQLERASEVPVDIKLELTKVGGILHEPTAGTFLSFQKRKSVLASRIFRDYPGMISIDDIAAEISPEPPPHSQELAGLKVNQIASLTALSGENLPMHSPAGSELDYWLRRFKEDGLVTDNRPEKLKHPSDYVVPDSFVRSKAVMSEVEADYVQASRKSGKSKKIITVIAIIAGILSVLFILNFLANDGLGAKSNVLQNGSNAIANIKEAQKNLENFDFDKAADNFALANDDFLKASRKLNDIGFSLVSFFVKLPGLSMLGGESFDKITAASDLLGAGRNLTKAGEELSLAFSGLYKTAVPLFLGGYTADENSDGIYITLNRFKEVLDSANSKIESSRRLLANINPDVLPEDNRESFFDFREKMPLLEKAIDDAAGYSDFLLNVVGKDGTKIYLVLFQNNSELRATGGFPGSYALLTFKDGRLNKIFVDDIYNPDGQIKDKIIPPLPLAHIVYNWETRDANWFADFPASARKVADFFKKGSGGIQVDGVFTFTPDILVEMLKVTGPVVMPDYGLNLGTDNFLQEIQLEVESKNNPTQPKTVLVDFQPLFLEKLKNQPNEKWVEIFKIMAKATEEKKILTYFKDENLENFAKKKDIAGDLKNVNGDFLSVVFSNIKGSKTDVVTDNFIDLSTVIDGSKIQHELIINRIHSGGDSPFRFYNLQNPAYVRVYVPRGAVLEDISGNAIVDYHPLVNYGLEGYVPDPDLAKIENSTYHPFNGVDVFEESGKTVFGFWMLTNPKSSSKAIIKYSLKNSSSDKYSLYWQKQSGTIGDKNKINASFRLIGDGIVADAVPELKAAGYYLVFNSDLAVDREIKFNIKY